VLDPVAVVAYTSAMTLEHANPDLKCASARTSNSRLTSLLRVLGALAISMFVAGGVAAAAPTPHIDESELLALGFKMLVPTTTAQQDLVKRLAPGQIRPMQRTGKKFYIVPDASRKQIYVGGPNEYAAYLQAHPDSKLAGQEGAKQASAYRAKQDVAMKKATARDLSDPFLGVSWYDLGW
jgi:hypothetical protein